MNHSTYTLAYALRAKRHQQGVILIVALIMLLVMTVAGVTTMSGATLQERIAGNQRQRAVSRINADRALRAAEAYLNTLHGDTSMSTSSIKTDFFGEGTADADGLYVAEAITGGGITKPLTLDRLDASAWTVDNSIAVPNEANVNSRYVIEYLGSFDEFGFGSGNLNLSLRKVFRITSIGYGDNTNVVSILESRYLEASQQK